MGLGLGLGPGLTCDAREGRAVLQRGRAALGVGEQAAHLVRVRGRGRGRGRVGLGLELGIGFG